MRHLLLALALAWACIRLLGCAAFLAGAAFSAYDLGPEVPNAIGAMIGYERCPEKCEQVVRFIKSDEGLLLDFLYPLLPLAFLEAVISVVHRMRQLAACWVEVRRRVRIIVRYVRTIVRRSLQSRKS